MTGYARVTTVSYARGGADFVDTRASHLTTLEDLERTSLDFYTTLRSVAQQRRQAQIEKARQGKP
jgi:phospholipid-binding lipoprotein MlaA